MGNPLRKILDFMYFAEKLKCELRDNNYSNGQKESVAAHTWSMSLLAVLLEPYLKDKVNLVQVLKMITIHDLVEEGTSESVASP